MLPIACAVRCYWQKKRGRQTWDTVTCVRRFLRKRAVHTRLYSFRAELRHSRGFTTHHLARHTATPHAVRFDGLAVPLAAQLTIRMPAKGAVHERSGQELSVYAPRVTRYIAQGGTKQPESPLQAKASPQPPKDLCTLIISTMLPCTRLSALWHP